MCTGTYLPNNILSPLETVHLPRPCSVCTKSMLMWCEDWDFNLCKFRKFRVNVPTATLPLTLSYNWVFYCTILSCGFTRAMQYPEKKMWWVGAAEFFPIIILQSHFVCWALSICVMWFETDSESLSKIMDMSYRCTDKSTNSVRWRRIHACKYAHISRHESQSELCLLLSDESGCHLRFTVMSLTLIASVDSHLHRGRICARKDESKALLFSWNEK